MEHNEQINAIKTYYSDVLQAYKLGNIETAYNEPIARLLSYFECVARDLSGERSGDTGENIDIKLWHDEESVTEMAPFAGIEAKKVGGIDTRAEKQIVSESKKYGNVILTDNLDWRFYQKGEEKPYAVIHLISINGSELILEEEKIDIFISVLNDFLLTSPTQIKSANKLAEYMAMHAKTIRSLVLGILKDDGQGQPLIDDYQKKKPMFPELCGLYKRIKTELQPMMTVNDFSDMYAQTIVYGFFIARYNDTTYESFDRIEAVKYLQEESELLKQFFMHIIGPGKKNAALEKVIDKLCYLYSVCDINSLLDKDEKRDTIVHFYEDFLTFYDAKLRKDLGVFYTPVEAVDYLVSMVDNILVNDLNISGGLSNNDVIDITVPCTPYQARNNKWVHEKTISVPRVAILDPACGTGTFGAEIVKHVKNTYFSGSREVFYEGYIQDKNSLMSRLIGFEIMMTSYVVAHLKFRRTITETIGHAPTEQIPTNIFLTNTLTAPNSSLERNNQVSMFDLIDFSAAITEEAYSADTWKTRRPVRVIIGNPPYLGASKNPYDISAYKKEVDGITDLREQKDGLNNDYIKFFRFAEQIIQKNNEGVLAFVSDNSFLDNITCRGMRGSLLRTFNKIYIVNLHGNSNKRDTAPDGSIDENIFDIKQGVSLFIGVKDSSNDEWAKVYYTELWGLRKSKLKRLSEKNLVFKELDIDEKMAYFIPFGDEKKASYNSYIGITELFPTYVTGVQSARDNVAYAYTREELVRRMNIVKNSTSDQEILDLWGKFTDGQTATSIRNDVLSDGVITKIAYRPFDKRWTYYSGRSCGWIFRPREHTTMGHLLVNSECPVGKNFGLVFYRTSSKYYPPFVADSIIAHRLFSAQTGTAYIAPLYLYSNTDVTGECWTANIASDVYDKLTQYMNSKPSALEVFDYVYGILHDPIYTEAYEQYLCKDYQRIPVVNMPENNRSSYYFYVSEELFKQYVEIGSKLRKLHLMQNVQTAMLTIEPQSSEDMNIGDIKYSKGVLALNKHKKIMGIPQDVWDYQIGGHVVIDKWLKEHKGEELSLENFEHLSRIVGAISETLKLTESLKNLHDSE